MPELPPKRLRGLIRHQVTAAVIVLVVSGCSLFQPAPVAVEPRPQPRPTVPQPPAPEEPAAPEATQRPGRAEAEAVLSGLPARELAFMLEFRERVQKGDWEWVLEHAEEQHYAELVRRTGMDLESYLTFLLRMGESFDRRIRRDDSEPGYFSPYDAVEVVYTDHRREHFGTVVEGLFYNRAQRSIDFTVTLLGELVEIRLTGAYY
ncbi:MAG: hypothetical protein EA384_06740 [Spirochaetaceae bacterium]|nr:MAG: hypothetical protein EA384_06740 [Spirochaetaceae bacterium]